ncbi:CoB--CoM heterodisulfide reductase iron-sulfur subunit B family protein [Desulfobacterales bacterium HSG16]|nr:CoB--CoM heterodisulfide reductase iron-sulfur subunit B family protein [Desulfobacterales bacterium HSG16]
MNYLYYPGCSLEGTAREYNISTRSFMKAAGIKLTELEEWTCCGASAAASVSPLLSSALPAINLAVAESMSQTENLLIPCSACYLNLKNVEEKARKEPGLLKRINKVLAEKNLNFKNRTKVRHLLDVMAHDIGAEKVKNLIKKDFSHLTIAPYYGCQCLRPYPVFDDPEEPVSMEPLIKATGALVHSWNMGGKCCGASHMNTKIDVGLELVYGILKAARGADAIVTVCPMCQMNLEAYQDKIELKYKENLNMTILYLPQLLCLAMGMSEDESGIESNMAVTKTFKEKMKKLPK